MRLLVVLLAVVGAATAVPTHHEAIRNQRIVGGVPTTVEKHPFMANMQYNLFDTTYFQACGGSLISSTSIVSAAHCYYGDPSSFRWRVLLGTSDRTSGGSAHSVARIVTHEYYDRPWYLDHDIAVMILRDPAVFSATVQPIKLAAKDYDLPDFATVTVIGWGTLTSGGLQPDQLQEVDLDVIPQEICEERYRSLKEDVRFEAWPDVTARMLCAGILDVGGKDACQGDSGGPVVHGDVLVGVVSWGEGCADPFYPGVNARVSAFTEWILLHGATESQV